jgi:hypothetical protein
MKRACILTDFNYFKWLIQSHSRGEDVGNVLSSSDFLIMDRSAGQLTEQLEKGISTRNIFRQFNIKVLGVGNQIEQFARSGHFNSGQSEFYPEFALGLSEENRMLIQELTFGGIVVEDLNSLSRLLHVSSKIAPGPWLKEHLRAGFARISVLEIHDPYLLEWDTKLFCEILRIAKDKGIQKLEIFFKNKKNHSKQDKIMEYPVLERYKKTIEDLIGFSPSLNVLDKSWFHDRKVVIDGMVYMLGHSFNIPNGTYTYSIGIDKITYNKGLKT